MAEPDSEGHSGCIHFIATVARPECRGQALVGMGTGNQGLMGTEASSEVVKTLGRQLAAVP